MILANLEIILPPEIEGARVAGHNKLCHINQSAEKKGGAGVGVWDGGGKIRGRKSPFMMGRMNALSEPHCTSLYSTRR